MQSTVDNRLWTKGFFWILALSLSYLYCLPLLRTGVVLGVTASEVRLYDIIFVIVFLSLILPRLPQFMSLWHRLSASHRYLLYWIIVGLFGLILLAVFRGERFLIGFIRYIRFFSFSSVFILIYVYVRNKRQLNFLYVSILLAIIAVSVLGTLQGLGILPNFWPDYYFAYWQNNDTILSTSTLAPNHAHYSLVMSIGIVMVFAKLKAKFRFNWLNLIFIAGLVPMVYSMIASQGRSGWLVVGVYMMYTVIVSRGKFMPILLLAFSVFIIFNYVDTKSSSTSSSVSIREILLYRSINTHKDLGRTSLDFFEEEGNYIERIDDNRWYIYKNSLKNLAARPQYWLFGAGFQNASRAIGGVAIAAHNAYINVFAEHGIIGLTIYLIFLYQLFQLGFTLKRNAKTPESYNFANEWIGLYLGILAANFFGEIIYPGRALFTFLGTFFVTAGLFLHPAWNSLPKPSKK